MSKRKTKAQIKEEARSEFLSKQTDRLRAAGYNNQLIESLAEQHGRTVAEEARPSAKTRQKRKEESAWLDRAKAGKPPEFPPERGLLRFVTLTAFFGKRPPERIARNPDGTFTAFVRLNDKLHKLCKVPNADGAARVASVARIAAWVLYAERSRVDGPGPDEFAATACLLADYPLAFKRVRGRPARGVVLRGQFSGVEAVTSGMVVKQVGRLLERSPICLPAGDGRATSRSLWALVGTGRDRDLDARRMVATEVTRWLEQWRARYRAADLLTAENEETLKRRAKEYGCKLTSFSIQEYEEYIEAFFLQQPGLEKTRRGARRQKPFHPIKRTISPWN